MENASYDSDFNVLTRELLSYNPVADAMEKVSKVGQGNASYEFTWISGNLTGIAKTIGATTYSRTLTWTDGELTEISTWS